MSRTPHRGPKGLPRVVVAWRVTHVDPLGARHRRVVRCRSFSRAQRLAEVLWGPAQYMAVIALGSWREVESWNC